MAVAVQHMAEHVLNYLEDHRTKHANVSSIPPLFVAVQGPQGSGKTYLTSRLREVLQSEPHLLAVAVLSIDDLYLPHNGLVELAQSHPDNKLLRGRGQPGTHDVEVGSQVLYALKRINEPGADAVTIPTFEKSLFDGEGDRLEEGTVVHGPINVVVMEGWCVGFCPTTQDVIKRRYEEPVKSLEGSFNLKDFKIKHIMDVNERIRGYVDWWAFFNLFIQIKPPASTPYSVIYKWRLDQEHNMKARNGGKGMTDDQVKQFVDRYIPGYVFFGDGVTEGAVDADDARTLPPWLGKGLRIIVNENREVVEVEHF